VRLLLVSLGVVTVALLPLLADRLRPARERCVENAVAVDPAFRVRIRDGEGRWLPFCGVTCAERWLRHAPAPPLAILVVDCATGRELSAEHAFYVRAVATLGREAPDAVRVFAHRREAQRYADTYGGRIMGDAPLGSWKEEERDDGFTAN